MARSRSEATRRPGSSSATAARRRTWRRGRRWPDRRPARRRCSPGGWGGRARPGRGGGASRGWGRHAAGRGPRAADRDLRGARGAGRGALDGPRPGGERSTRRAGPAGRAARGERTPAPDGLLARAGGLAAGGAVGDRAGTGAWDERVGGPVVGGAAVAGVPGRAGGCRPAPAERGGGGCVEWGRRMRSGPRWRWHERVPEVVVTLGAGGALWTDGSSVCRVPAATDVAGTPLDTTGAGDAFAAGFLVARLSGAGPEDALGRAAGSPLSRSARPGRVRLRPAPIRGAGGAGRSSPASRAPRSTPAGGRSPIARDLPGISGGPGARAPGHHRTGAGRS